MTTNIRISFTILSLGFAFEGAAELYSFVSRGTFRPGATLLFVLPVAMTLAGLLFVWLGQREWNDLHRSRVRQAHRVFGASLIGAVVAGAVVTLLVLRPSLGAPAWARGLFGIAVGSLVFGTFVTYALLVFHLVTTRSKALLLASLGWALLVAGFVGAAMAANLPAVLSIASHRSLSVPSFVGPVDGLASYLFVSYFLLLAAYVEAHAAILHGPGASDDGPRPPAAPGARAAMGPDPR
jgi:uncharacterized membrane protein YidH (DUF202 family)